MAAINQFVDALGASLLAGSGPSGAQAFTSLTRDRSALKARTEELNLKRREDANKRVMIEAERRLEMFREGLENPTLASDPKAGPVLESFRRGATQALRTLGSSPEDSARLVKTFVPAPVEQFQSVTDAQGNIIGQKSSTTGKVATDPRTQDILSLAEIKSQADLASAKAQAVSDIPTRVQRQETGPPGAFGSDITDANTSKAILDVTEGRTDTENLVTGINQVIDFVGSPDFVGGITGEALNLFNSGLQQASQILGRDDPLFKGGTFNMAVRDIDNLSKENISFLRRAAISGNVRNSAIARLSFIIAKSLNPDGKISDADVKGARDILEGSADRAATILQLRNISDITQSEFNTRAKNTAATLGLEGDPRLRPFDVEKPPPSKKPVGKRTVDEILKSMNLQ